MTAMSIRTRTIFMCLVVLVCLARMFTIVSNPAEYNPTTNQAVINEEGK